MQSLSETGSEIITKETPILEVKDLVIEFHSEARLIRASNHVSLQAFKGRTLGIVGESGSGKSVLCKAILGLIPTPPGRILSGEIFFDGKDILTLSDKDLQEIRGVDISMIFQNPMTSLNPVWPIGDQITEGLRVHQGLKGEPARKEGVRILEQVGIPSPERRLNDYPHTWSGGMLQRAVIAMAMATGPKLLLADEPTTALDVTIQDQILSLLLQLQEKNGMGLIIVTHDLAIVSETCDDIIVMYAGSVMESASTEEIFISPHHPYTLGLLRCIPRMSGQTIRLSPIPGNPPNLANRQPGCPFEPRCAYRSEACQKTEPDMQQVTPNHFSACLFPERIENEAV
jgi:oligopeptide/dipeptide ABC transporter ATP-binding protein